MTPGVVRVGNTVRRPPNGNLTFVAELLELLRLADARVAPRYLGRDEAGRGVFEWIDGTTTTHPSERDESAYAAGARMLRRLHDATAGHPLAGGEECVVHGDPGPFNTIFRHGLPVTFIDWDSAAPGSRLSDLAYLGWTWCVQSTGGVPVTDQARRLRAVLDAYGDVDGEDLLAAVAASQLRMAGIAAARLAAPPLCAAERAHWTATLRWARSDRDLLARHLPIFRRALGGARRRGAR